MPAGVFLVLHLWNGENQRRVVSNYIFSTTATHPPSQPPHPQTPISAYTDRNISIQGRSTPKQAGIQSIKYTLSLPSPPLPPLLPPAVLYLSSSHNAEFSHTEPRGVHAPALVYGLLEVGKEAEHLFLLRDVVRDAAALPSPAGHTRARGARPSAVSVSTQDRLGLGRSDHPG